MRGGTAVPSQENSSLACHALLTTAIILFFFGDLNKKRPPWKRAIITTQWGQLLESNNNKPKLFSTVAVRVQNSQNKNCLQPIL